MKIGKKVRVVTSPKREIRKAGEKVDKPIPVELPVKIPEKVEAEWKFIYGTFGMRFIDNAIISLTSVTS